MPIFIYNSLKREKEEFIPLDPKGKEVKMYVCGPTVYDAPHIGHARSAYIFDVVRRYLEYRDYKVKFVRNVTDVDDKIIDKAKKEYAGEDLNSAVSKVSAKYLDLYHEDMKSLGILDPDVEPKATEYVCPDKPLMQKFIQQLIDKGCAYVSEGDVYFDIKKAKGYGKLSNQAIEKMESGARIALGEKKKDPLDFALWKSAKPGEPAWDSPWGLGRPGWHIECSVMSSDILGDEFDIHGGGIDLIFPHHENEIAQSEGAGKKFAHYWIHHGLLTINGQKMSKSLGNFITVKDFINKHKYSDLLKLLFLSTHYSHPVDYTEEKVEEAKSAYAGIINLMHRLDKEYGSRQKISGGGSGAIQQFKIRFDEYMDDDFNTPRALSVLFEMVKLCNIEFDSKDVHKAEKLNYAFSVIKEMAEILGLDFIIDVPKEISDDDIEFKISARKVLKGEKKFTEADQVRKELESKGIILEDTKDGTTWRRKL
ncbi:MAG TPA: cysteine--tRNA ligase [Candidatus Omnitrophota bacterium]|nr:cysteine--tRNA ligase [Candidatus Omnitrophota bacterium]HPT39508.1 cysteine--tRNA ligase [Candidatus Omnitrophota bacterium]